MKVVLSLIAGAAISLAVASPASAQYVEELTVETTNPAPGEQLLLEGDGFAANAEVVVTIESRPVVLARVTADAGGAFSVRVTIPTGIEAGGHTLKATGRAPDGSIRTISQPIRVGGSLSRTGLDVLAGTVAGGGLIAVGVILAGARRRRTRSTEIEDGV